MAGITAFINYREGILLQDLLSRTLQASYCLPEMKTVVAETTSAQIAFGGTFPKHFQRKTETCKIGAKTIIFYGELYNTLDDKTEAEFSLHTFLHNGIASPSTLNGPFILFIWDDDLSELTIVTDRLGRFPVFYCEHENTTIVTTDIHSVFNAGILIPTLHEESIVDFLTIGFPIGGQSLFREVKRIAGGNVMTISRRGIMTRRYWNYHYTNTLYNAGDMVDVFKHCVERAIKRDGNTAVTLSGGWDSRTTCSVLPQLYSSLWTVTYGIEGSTDVELAGCVTKALNLPHLLASPGRDFFDSFDEWSRKVIILSNGHLTIDLAFQIYTYNSLRNRFSTLLDSAGCEFRRGIRAQRISEQARNIDDVSRFLVAMYSTGVWNESIIRTDFYREYSSKTVSKLSGVLDACSAKTYGDKIDFFSTQELWAHHYAHGYGLQTNFIGCKMPFSDNEFIDLYLQAVPEIRWTHTFHRAVIHRYATRLEKIPISHGSCKVPYGESIIRYFPVIFHKGISFLASNKKLQWLKSIDNYKPFRPYNHWYINELDEYVREILSPATSNDYLNIRGVQELFDKQKQDQRDYSHGISILLTLAHLLEYVKGFSATAR